MTLSPDTQNGDTPVAMKIGPLSQKAGVSRSTIRNYVRSGILHPPVKVGLNLYVYNQSHLDRLQRIRQLKESGSLSLEHIKFKLDEEERTNAKNKLEKLIQEGTQQDQETVKAEFNQEKKELILDTAIEAFNRLGYEQATIQDIADSLHMGKGTLYLYFQNKRDLLLECFDRLEFHILSLEAKAQVQAEKGFFRRHSPRFEGFQQGYSKFAGVMNLIRTASWSPDAEIRKRARKAYDGIIRPIREDLQIAIQKEEARAVDTDLAVYALVGAADNLCYRGTLDDRHTPEEITAFFYDWTVRVFRPESQQSVEGIVPEDCAGSLTDQIGTRLWVERIRFGGKPRFQGMMGQLEIEVDPARITSVTISEAESGCTAEVGMKDGQKVLLNVEGDVVVSGETALGPFQIALRNVSSIRFVRHAHGPSSISDRAIDEC